MDTQFLTTFVMVVDRGSMAAAARLLNRYAPPPTCALMVNANATVGELRRGAGTNAGGRVPAQSIFRMGFYLSRCADLACRSNVALPE